MLRQKCNNVTILKLTSLVMRGNYSTFHNRTYEEVRIPVPWGHIAGKWWGPRDKRPILGLHGWQDNCGTFDRLIPCLPAHVGYLTIDYPGHGLSSHLPPGVFHNAVDYVVTVRRIVNYFNWSKVSLLGHSWGGITGYLYATFYSKSVDFLICLDAIKPLIFDIYLLDSMHSNIDTFIKYDYLNNIENERHCYSFRELEQKLHEARDHSISLENCKYLLQRSVKPSTKNSNTFFVTTDIRTKMLSLQDWPQDVITVSISRLSCPTFMSYSSKRLSFYDRYMKAKDFVKMIGKINKNFEFHSIEGTHHVHLNNPERVEKLINNFINKYDTEDRSIGGIKQDIKVKY